MKSESWELLGPRVALGPDISRQMDVSLRNGIITSLRPPDGRGRNRDRCLDLRGFLVMPGLINAHDHLEFNLFPRLGSPPYANAGAWARDIHHPERNPVKRHLAVPLEARLRWGGVKNLLSGATTACHHNPFHGRTFTRGFAVRVPRSYGWAHSLEFSADLVERFHSTPAAWPFILHLGEAVDRRGRDELRELDRMGALDGRTVLVHAVALDRPALRVARSRGASLVWCPSSNIFLLGRTLGREALACGMPVALGTDSALTGEAGLLEEVRVAAQTGLVPVSRLYRMVTSDAAQVMRLNAGEGHLAQGGVADLVVVEDSGGTPAETLLSLSSRNLEYVFVRGEARLASARSVSCLPERVRARFHSLRLEDGPSGTPADVHLALDVARLFADVEPILDKVVLAHRKVLRAA